MSERIFTRATSAGALRIAAGTVAIRYERQAGIEFLRVHGSVVTQTPIAASNLARMSRIQLERLLGRLFSLRKVKRKFRTWAAISRRQRSLATFIGVTGSSAKSTTVALLSHILGGHGPVTSQYYQNTFGPLLNAVINGARNSDFVIVEAGVERKGQMWPMARILRPHVAIVTQIGIEHYTSFRNRAAVAEEKGALVAVLPEDGIAILNGDDEFAMSLVGRTKARIVSFGREAPADYRVTETSVGFPERLRMTISWSDGSIILQTRFPGEHFWLPVVAAAGAALELGVSTQLIVERVASFEPLRARCEILEVEGGPKFIIDTAKAPQGTLGLAFRMLEQAKAPYKRVVLGHISDYAGNPNPKYRDAYRAARAVAHQVIFVGDNAHRSKATPEDIETGRFLQFRDVQAVHKHIRATARPDELILLKGSQNLHLERIALAFDADVKCWVEACGKKIDCVACGLFGRPFEQHRNRRWERLPSRYRLRLRQGQHWHQ